MFIHTKSRIPGGTAARFLTWLALSVVLLLSSNAWAFQSFVVKDIRVEGLRRLSAGTVFNYLPVKVGERFNEEASERAIRSLFKAGFFKDARMARAPGDVLVVEIVERPAVSEIEIDGNKDIETDPLMEALKSIGLSQGRVFDRSLLDKVERELNRQYFARGKYGVEIDTTVTPLERNRVAVKIDISEGKAARIKQIDLLGVEAFDVDDLLDRFNLSGPGWLTWFTDTDQYAKQKLAGDLEELRSYYLDRGFITFRINSSQVTITPDKKDIYITINVTEGDVFTVNEVKLAGNLVVPDEELFDLVSIPDGGVFSRKQVTETAEALTNRLGDEGYAFANVNPIPEVDEENKTVSLTFFVDPGKRAYVRRINFRGNTKTADEVLRREMRQMEGAWFSTRKLERSRDRLDTLGYFESVNLETPAVPTAPDQVDAEFTVEEKPSGNLLAGIGYSQTQGVVLSTSVTQDNFFGSGKRVSFAVNTSSVNTQYQFAYTNPYWTVDGVSRGWSGYFRETNADQANVSDYNTDVFGGTVTFGIPISEFDRIGLTLRVEHTDLHTTTSSPTEIDDFVVANGSKFLTLGAELNWSRDTRNRAIMPTKGSSQSLGGTLTVPGGDLTYYRMDYKGQLLVPLSRDFIGDLRANVGYGDGYGDTNSLPFFQNYYAGGVRSVRGYKSNTLGPLDSSKDPFGGGLRVVANADLVIPTPLDKQKRTLRLTGFYDIGNVYSDINSFDAGDLRSSYGLSALWLSPMGPMTFVVAQPLNSKSIDQTETFQFTLGQAF